MDLHWAVPFSRGDFLPDAQSGDTALPPHSDSQRTPLTYTKLRDFARSLMRLLALLDTMPPPCRADEDTPHVCRVRAYTASLKP